MTKKRTGFGFLLLGSVLAVTTTRVAAAEKDDCTQSTRLQVLRVEAPEDGGTVWTWEIGIENPSCSPSHGSYRYDLVYTPPDGDVARDEGRSGEPWQGPDSEAKKVKTREALPKGAHDARLEKLRVKTCVCV